MITAASVSCLLLIPNQVQAFEPFSLLTGLISPIACKVIGCKTIREKNGIASSSRNILLSIREKKIASKIYKMIKTNKERLISYEVSVESIKKKAYQIGVDKIEYIKIFNINSFLKPFNKKLNYKIFISYYLGKTRLIDNF